MFWGSFSGTQRGPSLFWEKSWGSITAEKYSQKILPLIASKLQSESSLVFMQDGAPSHTARHTREQISRYGIQPIFWPSFSPDLNPIESVWDQMKTYIDDHYPEAYAHSQRSSNRLRDIVEEAWNSITSDQLLRLLRSMPTRCQAVIDADGGPIPF